MDATASVKGRFDAWTSFVVNASAGATYDSNGKCKDKPKGDTGVPNGCPTSTLTPTLALALALTLVLTLILTP